MPVLTCGGMRYQQSWTANAEVGAESQANVASILQAAFDQGLVHIETARGYGTSERQTGAALASFPRDKIIVQTKVAPTEDPDQFEHDVRDSLNRLKLPWVDLLSLHGVNNEQVLDWSLRADGCLERARALKQQGLLRHIGFSSHAHTDVIIAGIQDGRFDYVNLHYYWAFQSNARAVKQAAARDMGVFIISPNDKGGRLYAPPPKLVELTAPYSPMVYNDLWCLAQSDVHTLSIGARFAADFAEHLKAVQLLEQHVNDPRALIAPIEARLQATLEATLGRQWANSWSEGLPPWEQMPGRVNVTEILRLYNMARAYDMVDYAQARYNLLEKGGHWFPGHNAGKARHLDFGKALKHSPHAKAIAERLIEAHQMLAGAQQTRLQKDD